ncbi:MAG TPA: hypothetical protein VFH91_08580, partial [Pyrinomonadaceae bacterium]|nr:hypothetical protein [Pyrinomonadaceae bacterium]
MKSVRFTVSIILAVLFGACWAKKAPAPPASSGPSPADSPRVSETSQPPSPPMGAPKAGPGELQTGQASGSYTAGGQTVELKYAYAGHAVRFSTESLVILLTD